MPEPNDERLRSFVADTLADRKINGSPTSNVFQTWEFSALVELARSIDPDGYAKLSVQKPKPKPAKIPKAEIAEPATEPVQKPPAPPQIDPRLAMDAKIIADVKAAWARTVVTA